MLYNPETLNTCNHDVSEIQRKINQILEVVNVKYNKLFYIPLGDLYITEINLQIFYPINSY